MNKRTIKIAGAGISGLTAAINLAKAGYEVEVYEQKSYCGKYANDFEFLENWTFDDDPLEFLKQINIKTDFYIKPWHIQEILSPSFKSYIGKSEKPLMYLVKRGRVEGSIDRSLEAQAKELGINIIYNSTQNFIEADIVASGTPRLLEESALGVNVMGIKFKFRSPDRSIVLLDNNLSFKFYSYFIVNDNIGEIACCNIGRIMDSRTRLDLTVKKFEEVLNTKIKDIDERFFVATSFESFNFISPDESRKDESRKRNNQYFAGEAAGFQDYLAGFGMIYAFKSGYYAAKSIIENLDYDELWKKKFLKQFKIGFKNRLIFNRLSNQHFEKIIDILNSRNFIFGKLKGGDDFRYIMKRVYTNSLLAKFLGILKLFC